MSTVEYVYDDIVTGSDVGEAVLATLETWFSAFLRAYEYQRDIPRFSLPVPKTWIIGEDLDLEQGMPTPAIVVVNPGLSRRNSPRMAGDGIYTVYFDVAVGVIVEANNRPATRKLVRIYTSIVREILIKKRDLRGADWDNRDAAWAVGLEWLNETWDDDFPFADNQTISAGEVTAEVEVYGVVSRYGGPMNPNVEPDAILGEVQQVTATVKVKED